MIHNEQAQSIELRCKILYSMFKSFSLQPHDSEFLCSRH